MDLMAQMMSHQQSLFQAQQTQSEVLAQLVESMKRWDTPGTSPGVQQEPGPAPTQEERRAPEKKVKHSHPHIDKYDGESQSDYLSFRTNLEAKIEIDGDAIGSEREKVWYAFGRLSGSASGRIRPWVEVNKTSLSIFTLSSIISQMDTAFGDPRAVEKAVTRLNRMKQESQDFREFVNDFDKTLLEAGGWGWDDAVKKGYLKRALSKDLKEKTIAVKEDDTYLEYCSTVRGIADRLQEHKRNYPRSFYAFRQQTNAQQSNPNAMDWEPTPRVVKAAANSTPNRKRNGSSKQPRAKWVSKKELEKRKGDGRCFRCGGGDHMIRTCQYEAARRPEEATVTVSKAVAKPELEESSDEKALFTEESESENE